MTKKTKIISLILIFPFLGIGDALPDDSPVEITGEVKSVQTLKDSSADRDGKTLLAGLTFYIKNISSKKIYIYDNPYFFIKF